MESLGARSNETSEHLPDIDDRRPAGHHRVASCKGSKLVLVISFDYTETPGAGAIEHRTEDHHLTGIDKRTPVSGVARHDLTLLVGHVEGECRPGSLQSENKRRHARQRSDRCRMSSAGSHLNSAPKDVPQMTERGAPLIAV